MLWGWLHMRTTLNKRRPTVGQVFHVALRLTAVVGLLGLGPGVATAETGRLVYLPMPFHAEDHVIRTTACLQVTERVYAPSAWWESFSRNADAPERAVKAVIAAIKHKDRVTLLKLSHSTQGRDLKRFDEQAAAFFQQFEAIELVAMPRAYEFDGLVVFFAKLRSKEQSAFAPFIFAPEDDGSFGFLPYRTEKVTHKLLEDWFNSKWGPAATANPTYCTGDDIKRATHRISLVSSLGTPKQAWHPSSLFLRGASLDNPGQFNKLAARAKSTIEDLKSALVHSKIDDFVKHLTPEGGRRVKEWFASADQTERSGYQNAIMEQEPFFLFDASPLVVVYTRAPFGVQVMYFTLNAQKQLLWTNSSFITLSDWVFKRGRLLNAALLDEPFGNIAIK